MNRNEGRVGGIYVSPDAGAKMIRVPQVLAEAGKGLVGDRYHADLHKGFWQNNDNPRPAVREVSLFSLQTLVNSAFTPEETRRNFAIAGEEVDLLSLIGKVFMLGGVQMEGTEICVPCNRPSVLAGKKTSFLKEFKEEKNGGGGIRAAILTSGLISEGDLLRRP